MAHLQPSDGYTLQHMEAAPSMDLLKTVCQVVLSSDVSAALDRSSANALLQAACEKQPWTPDFTSQFHKTVQMVESATAPCFKWLPLAKDMVCTLLPSMATTTSGLNLKSHVDSIHAVVRQLYTTPGVEQGVAASLFGETDNIPTDAELSKAVASMQHAIAHDAEAMLPQDATTPHLWPLALAASGTAQAPGRINELHLPEFGLSLAEGLPLQQLRAAEEAAQASASAAAPAAPSQETQEPTSTTPPASQPDSLGSAAPGAAASATPSRLAGHKRQREGSPTTPAEAPNAAPNAAQVAAQPSADSQSQDAQEPSKGQAAYDAVLRTYPHLGSETRAALHSFLVQRNIDPSYAPPGLSEEGHFDYLLQEKQELDSKKRPATYRYEMRLFFDGNGTFIKRKVKVKATATGSKNKGAAAS